MGRRRKDIAQKESITRLSKVIEDEDFIRKYNELSKRVSEWKSEIPIIDERLIDWNYPAHCYIYSGFYYDLREFCDHFNLLWPMDGALLYRCMGEKTKEDNIKTLIPDYCPPEEQWIAWRMAKKESGGFGRPRQNELDWIRTVPNSENASEKGLTINEIVQVIYEIYGGKEDNEKKTISNWIKNCDEYLLQGGSQQKVVELAGLDFFENLLLQLWIESEIERREMEK
jgi:hypothetical protein